MGTVVVLILESVLSDDQMSTWGWRLPFLLALPLGLVGLFLRTRLDDTPVFRDVDVGNEVIGSPWARFVDLLANYRKPIIMFGMVVALNIANYTLLAYLPTYL